MKIRINFGYSISDELRNFLTNSQPYFIIIPTMKKKLREKWCWRFAVDLYALSLLQRMHSTVFISFAKQQKQKQMHEKKVHVLKSNNHYFRREKQCTHEKLYTNPVLVSLKKVIHKSIPCTG